MVEQHLPHYYARAKASDNKGVVYASEGTTTTEDQEVARNRPSYTTNKLVKRQDWHNLDLSGQGVRKIARALFSYDFLVELYIASNKITVLPPDIGKLRCLKVLEASHNELHELPPEIGMCTNLQQLILFNNHITSLPYELGFLYKLEMLGLHGNPLMNGPLKDEIMNKDTKSLINSLLVDAPGKFLTDHLEPSTPHTDSRPLQSPLLPLLVFPSRCKMMWRLALNVSAF